MSKVEEIKPDNDIEKLKEELGIEILEASSEKDAASKILEALELDGEDILKNSLEESDV